MQPSIGGALGATSLVLGTGPSVALHTHDVYQSSGLQYGRNLTALYPHAPLQSGAVRLAIQGKQYLSEPFSVPRSAPVSVVALLRTPSIWIDRTTVRFAYQVADSRGSVVANGRYSVAISLLVTNRSAWSITCASTPSAAKLFVGYCSTQLPTSWFGLAVQTAYISVNLIENNGQLRDRVTTKPLVLEARPSWWDATLRSATIGNGLSAPGVTSIGGVFATLPVSPLRAGDAFDVFIYANTAGLSLNTWRVRLYFSSALLGYLYFSQNSDFNSATLSASPGEVSWLATGVKSTASNGDVTGSSIYLLRVSMVVLSSTTPGQYDGDRLGFYPRATELISGAPFVQDTNGEVFDARGSAQTLGQLTIKGSSVVGVLAYQTTGFLANLAPLTGVVSAYALSIVQVNDDERDLDSRDLVSSATCSTEAPSSVLLSVEACVVQAGPLQNGTQQHVSVQVSHAGHNATVSFGVYTPWATRITLEDTNLNRISGAPSTSCSDGQPSGHAAYPYQRTKAYAFADELDATALVSFVVLDSSVADVSPVRLNIIRGRTRGNTSVHLSGRSATWPSVVLTVSDTEVTAITLVARVVTHASWSDGGRPPSQYSYGDLLPARVTLSNSMTAEGDGGFMFTRVIWSDGAGEDVGHLQVDGIETVSLSVGSSGVSTIAPIGSENFWWVGVAVGAVKECVSTAFATWEICGVQVATGELPLFLNMPSPVSIQLVIDERRLTSSSDEARLHPMNVATSSTLTLTVAFDDGSERDLSTDSRVNYSTIDRLCAQASDAAGQREVVVQVGAACNQVVVIATVTLGDATFVTNTTRPVVYLASLVLGFSGYPDRPSNRNRKVTTVGLVPCFTSVYFHATSTVLAYLTDSVRTSYDVTSRSTFATSAPTVVFLSSASSTRMQARSAGNATITATFASTSTNASLVVQDQVLDEPSTLSWNVPNLDNNNLQYGEQVVTTVQVTYASGLQHTDLAGDDFDSWVDIRSLVSFSSDRVGALQLSDRGGVRFCSTITTLPSD